MTSPEPMTFTETVVTRGPAQLVVKHYGDPGLAATPILLIHPINTSGAVWSEVVTALEGERYLVVPDMSGFGASSTVNEYSLELWAADCLAAVDAAGVGRFHAIGGSLGGTIATWLAGTHPDRVASVLALGSPLYTVGGDKADVLKTLETKSVPEMFAEIIPKYSLAPGTSDEVIAKVLATCNPNGPDDVRRVWTAANNSDARPQAAGVIAPATVVTGEFDFTCPPEGGAEFAEALGAPHIILPGLGHIPMLEDSAVTVRIIREHLARAEAVQP